MPLAASLARTGPAEALAVAAERVGLPLDREDLLDRFERHENPGSLRALVEIAPEVGLEVRAFRSDLAGLVAATLPAIVHVVDPVAEEAGFGVLVERGEDRYAVTDGEGGETLVFRGGEFERVWSGIVVTVARREAAAPPAAGPRHGNLRMRLAAWYRKGQPLEQAAAAARLSGAAAFFLLVLASGWALGTEIAPQLPVAAGAWLAGVMAFVALAASHALFHKSRTTLVPGAAGSRLASKICGRGEYADCLGVLSSRYSRLFGIDWGSFGVAWFGSLAALMATGLAVGASARASLWAWIAVAFLLALPGSLAMIAIQVWPLRRFCPLCNLVHATEIAGAVLAVLYLPRALAAGVDPLSVAPFALLHAALVLGAFGLIVPLLELRLESKVNRARLGWIGATPWGAIAEIAGRPRAVSRPPEPVIRIGAEGAPFRLDALVHPMCSGCGPVVEKLVALERRHAGKIGVNFHLAPRDPGNPADPTFCAALSTSGILEGGPRAVERFLAIKNNPWPLFEDSKDGVERPLATLFPGTAVPEEAVAKARASVDEAGRLSDRLERGTPTLLLNGRFWDAGVEDLDALLATRADLLAEILRAPRGGA